MRRARCLLIQPNVGMKDTGTCINHGIASLAGAVKKAGCAELLFHILDDSSLRKKACKDLVLQHKFDIVAFSSYSNQWHIILETAEEIKRAAPKTAVLCGGPHATLFPHSLGDSLFLDGAVVGEGETAFVEVLQKIAAGEGWCGIRGVWHKDNEERVVNCGVADRTEELDALPDPDYSIYPAFVIKNYPGISFSRGCPFLCSYCCNHAYRRLYPGDTATRFLSPRRAADLALSYKRLFDVSYFNIDDDTFTKNREWLQSFLDLWKNEIALPFNCNARPETINIDVVDRLKQAGCRIISIGIENGNDELRAKVLNRRMPDESIINAARIIHEGGLELATFNMVGVPDETWADFMKTVRINNLIHPEKTQMTVYYPFRGTALGDYCYSNKLIKSGTLAASYFGRSILNLPSFPPWKIHLAHRLFKFLVFLPSSPPRAFFELAKDSVKALPFSHLLIQPYLTIKEFVTGLHT